jgi:hypothetical protein
MTGRISLTHDQAAAILDMICEREVERLRYQHAWIGLTPEARSGLELLRAAKDEMNRLRRGTLAGRPNRPAGKGPSTTPRRSALQVTP